MTSSVPSGRARILFLTILALAFLLPGGGSAQVARVELHPFQFTTLTDQQFLTGQKEGQPVALAGELRFRGREQIGYRRSS